jgi:hypothetical protein
VGSLVRVGGANWVRSGLIMPKRPRRPRRPRRKADRQRAALALLETCRDGCPEALMVAHGFTLPEMVALVRAGLATATGERVVAGKRTMEVARVKITEAGRRALTS